MCESHDCLVLRLIYVSIIYNVSPGSKFNFFVPWRTKLCAPIKLVTQQVERPRQENITDIDFPLPDGILIKTSLPWPDGANKFDWGHDFVRHGTKHLPRLTLYLMP